MNPEELKQRKVALHEAIDRGAWPIVLILLATLWAADKDGGTNDD